MYYIHGIASISHQDSFRNENILEGLKELSHDSEIVSPDYKEFIPPASLRRLSPVLRMGLTTAIECQSKVKNEFDAISVGTALGCLKDTEKFLNTFITATSDFLSPTAFIQSTHNTIGGQISLGLKNHGYNMTHTQNNLSFEVALLDAMLCIDEGRTNVLVGAADEKIDFLEQVQPFLIDNTYPLSSGASFFVLSPTKNDSGIAIKEVYTDFNCSDVDDSIQQFLKKNERTNIDVVLYDEASTWTETFEKEKINYLKFSGMHFSASAFGLHVAHDVIRHTSAMTALVINHMCHGRLGLTLIEQS